MARNRKGIYQRKVGGNWYYDIVDASGKRTRRSLGTTVEADAQREYDRLKAESWDRKHDAIPDYFWQQAETRWLKEAVANKKRSVQTDIERLNWWRPKLDGKLLRDITYDFMYATVEKAKAERGWANATANQYIAIVRTILNCAASPSWKMLPAGKIVFHTYKPGDRRVRDLPAATVAALLTDPKFPEHQRDMFAFALATGLRQGNVRGLRWEWLDLDRSCGVVPRGAFKTKKDHGFPLNADALAILDRWKGRHAEYVFVYNGEPVAHVNNTSWRKALKRHGITDFRWHDTRHVWASALIKKGVPSFAVMELAGWSSPEMVRRYAHLNVDHLKGLAAQIEGLASTAGVPSVKNAGTNTAHNKENFTAQTT